MQPLLLLEGSEKTPPEERLLRMAKCDPVSHRKEQVRPSYWERSEVPASPSMTHRTVALRTGECRGSARATAPPVPADSVGRGGTRTPAACRLRPAPSAFRHLGCARWVRRRPHP